MTTWGDLPTWGSAATWDGAAVGSIVIASATGVGIHIDDTTWRRP